MYDFDLGARFSMVLCFISLNNCSAQFQISLNQIQKWVIHFLVQDKTKRILVSVGPDTLQ